MILEIKRKAIAINSDSSLIDVESQLIDLKKQIKILDHYLDLQCDEINQKEGFSPLCF